MNVPSRARPTSRTSTRWRAGSTRRHDRLGGLDGVITAAGQMMTGEMSSGTPQRWRELIGSQPRRTPGDHSLCDRPTSLRPAAATSSWSDPPVQSRPWRVSASTRRQSGAWRRRSTACASSWHRRGSTSAWSCRACSTPRDSRSKASSSTGRYRHRHSLFRGRAGSRDHPGPSGIASPTSSGCPRASACHEIVIRPTGQLNP